MFVLLVEDDDIVAGVIKGELERRGYKVLHFKSADEAINLNFEEFPVAVISDLKLPGKINGMQFLSILMDRGITSQFFLITAFPDIPTAIKATKMGVEFLVKGSFTPEELVGRIMIEEFDEPIAESQSMRQILSVARKIAKSDSTVLIMGESGVGKEVLARYIHNVSPRALRPFVALNITAIPDTLLESELFGYEKGAFTGADRRKIGKFELAHGGTLLLDEIGDMPLQLQPKILRVLQEKKIERLGGRDPIPIDVRVIATTNRNLEKLVADGKFREDLFFRLNVFPIKIPPLRERKDDILPLAEYFLKRFSKKYQQKFYLTDKAKEKILNYDFPGNVRELQNIIERAIILSSDGEITEEHIIFSAEEFSKVIDREREERVISKESMENDDKFFENLSIEFWEKILIKRALEKTRGNKTKAAELLGINVRTLRNKLKEYKMEDEDGEKSNEI